MSDLRLPDAISIKQAIYFAKKKITDSEIDKDLLYQYSESEECPLKITEGRYHPDSKMGRELKSFVVERPIIMPSLYLGGEREVIHPYVCHWIERESFEEFINWLQPDKDQKNSLLVSGYETKWLKVVERTINEFFSPRHSVDAKKEEVVKRIIEIAKEENIEQASQNIATSIFTIIKPENHNPKVRREKNQKGA